MQFILTLQSVFKKVLIKILDYFCSTQIILTGLLLYNYNKLLS